MAGAIYGADTSPNLRRAVSFSNSAFPGCFIMAILFSSIANFYYFEEIVYELPKRFPTNERNATSREKNEIDSIQAQAPEKKKTGADADAFSKLQLFVPIFPGGFEEFQVTMVRSLRFFWPRDSCNTLVLLDDTVYNTEKEKENMTARVKSFFGTDLKDRVEVAYNPRSNKTLFKKGWNIQQLIMFWADNFTTAEFIGFVDDDTMFSKAVIPYDLFDSLGRPRALVSYPTDDRHKWRHLWYNPTNYSLGSPGYLDAHDELPGGHQTQTLG